MLAARRESELERVADGVAAAEGWRFRSSLIWLTVTRSPACSQRPGLSAAR